ncbi:MAG: metallophosphoesterase, partial [Prevotella sp.]|nr:metallophosphoesterase [Prevotella sp.]
MIARIIVPILLLTVLPYLYVDLRYLRRRHCKWWKRVLWWLPCVGMVAYSIIMASVKGFAPANASVTNWYLLLLGLLVVPMFVFMLSSLIGLGICKLIRSKNNWGNLVGLFLIIAIWYIVIYGSTLGFSTVAVRHVEYSSPQLPKAFDGYRIVHISDFHIGTYDDSRKHILQKAIDSINAQKADMVVFTGDLQNREPHELYPYASLLSSIKAKDGVYSVMGNHDYADYIKADDIKRAANLRETQRMERSFGWHLLLNDHATIIRDSSHIIIAGMENDGNGKHFPQKGDIKKTLNGVSDHDFIIMLEHDPTSWRRKILPQSSAQLTLSGHTHATQFKLFGWSLASMIYTEWGGMYYDNGRAINVSTGLGAFLPFRFGVPGEVVVITLKT